MFHVFIMFWECDLWDDLIIVNELSIHNILRVSFRNLATLSMYWNMLQKEFILFFHTDKIFSFIIYGLYGCEIYV